MSKLSSTFEVQVCKEMGKYSVSLMLSSDGLEAILLLHCWPVGIWKTLLFATYRLTAS